MKIEIEVNDPLQIKKENDDEDTVDASENMLPELDERCIDVTIDNVEQDQPTMEHMECEINLDQTPKSYTTERSSETSTKIDRSAQTDNSAQFERSIKPGRSRKTDRSAQTDIDKSTKTDRSAQTIILPSFSVYNYEHNSKAINFFTGMENFEKLTHIFSSLGDCSNLKYFYEMPPVRYNVFEQFFMTLLILRRHQGFEEISMLYQITLKQVANIFITWIRLMASQWKDLDLWLDRETVTATMPLNFQEKYPKARVVLHAIECPIKRPGCALPQPVTFSKIKNRNTIKFLIGIAPNGLITYVSPSYGGSATDREIVEKSNILHRFDDGDEILVDRGLKIQDLFSSYGVTVNDKHKFFKKGKKMRMGKCKGSVKVERTFSMLKSYQIFKQSFNQTETMLSSEIALVCAVLVNLKSNK